MFLDPNNSLIIIHWFPRLLGLIYFFALGAFLFQIKGLLGKEGILPISIYVEHLKARFGKKAVLYCPTLFLWNSSDRMLVGVVAAGTVFSVLLFFGVCPPLMLLLLFICHLSIVNAGQEFLSFGWETFFLEICCSTFFLTLTSTPNPIVWISLNLLLLRFHLEAGVSKIESGDANWRNLTAMAYHYLTQPLPNTVAYYIHRFPLWFHKASCALMFFIEIAVPFAIF